MSKKVKILIAAGAAVLALAILTLVLALVGFRFSSKHTLEKMWRDEAVIVTDDYDFYYTVSALHGEEAQQISAFRAVKKSGFLRRAVDSDKMVTRTLYLDGTADVAGTVTTLKGDGCYYHFFNLPYDLPASLEPMYKAETFIANGAEVTTVHHSYFVTEAELSTLQIAGITLKFTK